MNRYLTLIVTAILAASVIFTCACTSSNKGPNSDNEVLSTFSQVAEQRTITARDNIYSWWAERLDQGSVTYMKAENYYKVEFLSMSGVETWGINMETSKIWPINHKAIVSAFSMFCSSKDDPSTDCQQWAQQLLAAD